MKKLFPIMTTFILLLSTLSYGQDDTNANVVNETEDTVNTNEGSNVVQSLEEFAPTFDVLRGTDINNVDKDLNALKAMTDEIGNDYLNRVKYKADLILSEYTNANHMNTNDFLFYNPSYYSIVAPIMATDYNVSLGINKVNEAINYYNRLKVFSYMAGKTNEMNEINYDINLYAGILYMYAGELRTSLTYFNDIVNQKLSTNNQDLLIVNKYLAGINNMMISKQTSYLFVIYYYNEVFNNLWDVVTLEGGDNIDAKYEMLINIYHPYVYTDTVRFKNIYSDYFDRLGIVYADTEEEILGSEVRDEFKNTDEDTENTQVDGENATTTETESADN